MEKVYYCEIYQHYRSSLKLRGFEVRAVEEFNMKQHLPKQYFRFSYISESEEDNTNGYIRNLSYTFAD